MSSSSSTPKLTEEEKRQIDLKRRDFFKGTIAIMVIYGVFILGISILGIVSENGRTMLFVNGFTFTVTFIAGTILVILLLLAQLLNYEAAPAPVKFSGENLACPDFWVLKETPQAQLDRISNTQVRQLSKYYCENPKDTLAADMDLPAADAASDTKSLTKLREIKTQYNFTSSPGGPNALDQGFHMQCNRMYPEYMAYMDKANFADNPTAIRCEYLKQCRTAQDPDTDKRTIPWTSVCPNPPS